MDKSIDGLNSQNAGLTTNFSRASKDSGHYRFNFCGFDIQNDTHIVLHEISPKVVGMYAVALYLLDRHAGHATRPQMFLKRLENL